MSEFKLTYFPIGVRAEPMRMAFWHSKVAFEDNRVTFEDRGEMKAKLPGGQLPVLEWNGKTMNESIAKLRFPLLFKKDFGEENQKASAEIMEKIVVFLTKKIKEADGKFLCGDKVTIADCFAAYFITTFFWNEGHPGGAAFTDAAQKHAAASAEFMAYAETIKAEFKDYVAKRDAFTL